MGAALELGVVARVERLAGAERSSMEELLVALVGVANALLLALGGYFARRQWDNARNGEGLLREVLEELRQFRQESAADRRELAQELRQLSSQMAESSQDAAAEHARMDEHYRQQGRR